MPDLMTPSVRDYLHDLDRALRDLPRARRAEIVRDIHAHIDAALADATEQSPAAVATILDHLGTPAEIADAAQAELPPAPARMAALDIVAVVLLLIGGVVVPVIGWLVGAVLLWTSSTWRVKDKLLATLLVPGGLLAPAMLGLAAFGYAAVSLAPAGSCTTGPVPVHSPGVLAPSGASTAVVQTCTTTTGGGPGAGPAILAIVLLLITVGGPLFSTWWLIHHARRRG